MLSTNIKNATKAAHQELEGKVVRKLKAIRNNDDYADLLKYFYAYFSELEKVIVPYIKKVLPDYAARRDSTYLRSDIEELQSTIADLPAVTIPVINSTAEALGALYVMEGSIMGGPYIVQMLQKGGISEGFSFFSGYGEATGKMWKIFTDILNQSVQNERHEVLAIMAANATFAHFSDVFGEVKVA